MFSERKPCEWNAPEPTRNCTSCGIAITRANGFIDFEFIVKIKRNGTTLFFCANCIPKIIQEERAKLPAPWDEKKSTS